MIVPTGESPDSVIDLVRHIEELFDIINPPTQDVLGALSTLLAECLATSLYYTNKDMDECKEIIQIGTNDIRKLALHVLEKLKKELPPKKL